MLIGSVDTRATTGGFFIRYASIHVKFSWLGTAVGR